MSKFKKLVFSEMSEDDIEDIKCELIDFYDEFMDEPFEEIADELSDEGVVELYNKIFSSDKPEDIKILNEWKEEYSRDLQNQV